MPFVVVNNSIGLLRSPNSFILINEFPFFAQTLRKKRPCVFMTDLHEEFMDEVSIFLIQLGYAH